MSDAAVIGIIEFGSTARNDADQYSDKDIFAVVEDVDADRLDARFGRWSQRNTTLRRHRLLATPSHHSIR